MLRGRATGVTVMMNSGQVGVGSTVRLRGNNSVSQGNNPLIYVDGIRVRNTGTTYQDEAGQSSSPLGDIHPDDIERIEVIKGAAASTLYGTEAAGGVIQIFTKRGASGSAAWSMGVDVGLNNMGHIADQDIENGLWMNDCTLVPPGGDPADFNETACPSGDWLANGFIHKYNLSVRGEVAPHGPGGLPLTLTISGLVNDAPLVSPGTGDEVVGRLGAADSIGVVPDMQKRCLGPTYPTHSYGINSSLTFMRRFTLDVLGEGQGGHSLSAAVLYQNTRRFVNPLCWDIQEKVANGDTADLKTSDWARCDRAYTSYGQWVQAADFFKIRSASLSYRIPEGWLPGQVRGATVRLQGRNLLKLTDFQGLDPEVSEDGVDSLYRQGYYHMPPFRTFMLSFKVDF